MANILLSCKKGSDTGAYIAALERFGCRVRMADEEQTGVSDALVLGGGGDISPKFYHYRMPIDRIHIEDEGRDELEFSLLCRFLSQGKPVLGICRGAQVIAAALGGTLIEDIPVWKGGDLRIRHMEGSHRIETRAGSLMRALIGKNTRVNSFHHQAVRLAGSQLAVSARAPDGIVEAVEHKTLPVLGIQWHPERMHNAEGIAIFEYFCRLADRK